MRPLRRNRLLLIASLAFLGAALGVTFNLLKPDGLVATSLAWPSGARESTALEPVRSDRFGAPCGVRGEIDGEVREVTLPHCTSYAAPALLRLDGRDVAVWEWADEDIAVGVLNDRLQIEEVTTVPRPRAAYGALLPRTSVASDGERLAVFYDERLMVVLDESLDPWPGGALQVAAARLGPRAPVLLGGVLALFLICLLGAGWALTLPWRLARQRREGRTLEVTLAARGTSVVVEGKPLELDLSLARTMTSTMAELAGRAVTLVLDQAVVRDGTYRALRRAQVLQVWPGDFVEASLRARSLRTAAAAGAVGALALLLLALDAYVVL